MWRRGGRADAVDFLERRRNGIDLRAEGLEPALQALPRPVRRGRIGRQRAQDLGAKALEGVEGTSPLRLDPCDGRRKLGAVPEPRVEGGEGAGKAFLRDDVGRRLDARRAGRPLAVETRSLFFGQRGPEVSLAAGLLARGRPERGDGLLGVPGELADERRRLPSSRRRAVRRSRRSSTRGP